MDVPQLRIVGVDTPQPNETAGDKLRRLQAELKAAATDEIHELGMAMDHLAEVANEVIAAGDAFPPGVRENCRTLLDELNVRRNSIAVLMQRSAAR